MRLPLDAIDDRQPLLAAPGGVTDVLAVAAEGQGPQSDVIVGRRRLPTLDDDCLSGDDLYECPAAIVWTDDQSIAILVLRRWAEAEGASGAEGALELLQAGRVGRGQGLKQRAHRPGRGRGDVDQRLGASQSRPVGGIFTGPS